jgi:hypothetical protein
MRCSIKTCYRARWARLPVGAGFDAGRTGSRSYARAVTHSSPSHCYYAAGGACPSRRGILSSMHAQLGACEAQIVVAGLAISRSSRVPLRTNTRCGRASAALNRCVPQVGQNLRCITLPLSATLRKSRNSPLTTIALLAKHVFTVALPAPMY